jgi:hypothetical protein
MRRLLGLGVAMGFLLSARPGAAQTYPAEMIITVPEVEVRSGPSKEFYATSKLRYGERVFVRRPDENPGWLVITPPAGSFSWILETAIERTDQYTGIVKPGSPVKIRAGSSLSNKPPDVAKFELLPGTIITILDGPMTGSDGKWLPIKAHLTEVRYIPADAVKPQQYAAAAPPAAPAASAARNPVLAQADQAYNARQYDQARQLYEQAYRQPLSRDEQTYCYNRLMSLRGNNQWQAGRPGNTGATPVSATASVPAAPTPGRNQWSTWGYLRTTAIAKDGQPMYVLQNKQGQALLYVTTPAGLSLRDYVGKTVALYGNVSYRPDDYLRREYMTATHVATP